MKGWLRVKEAQEYCSVSERTIHTWIKEDDLPYSKIKNIILINVHDLDKFIEKHRIKRDLVENIIKDLIKS